MVKKPFAFAIVALCFVIAFPVVSGAAAKAAEISAEGDKRSREELRTLAGQVHGNQDRPLADAVVYLKNTKTLVVKTFITEGNGSYRFPACHPMWTMRFMPSTKGPGAIPKRSARSIAASRPSSI